MLSYDYSRLIITSSLGFLIFAEVPTVWTWVGGAVIVGAVVYIARQESRARP